jgi:hypothetical protein
VTGAFFWSREVPWRFEELWSTIALAFISLSEIVMEQRNMTNEAENQTEKKTKPWLPDGLIIASIPIIAYTVIFIFESGYTSAFEIPQEFIASDLTAALIVSGFLLTTALASYFFSNIIFMITSAVPEPIARRLRRLFPPLLISFVLSLMYGTLWGWKSWAFVGCSLAIVIIVEFLTPAITQRGKGSYFEKLEARDQQRKKLLMKEPETITDVLKKRLGVDIGLFLFLLLVGGFLIHNAGRSKALTQRTFLVTNTSPEMVVLRIYGDKMVCAPFDRTTREVDQSFVILKIAEDSHLMLHREEIGPLSSRGVTSNQMHSPIPTPATSP